jgi:excinuclease UvrABC nuclease subunit
MAEIRAAYKRKASGVKSADTRLESRLKEKASDNRRKERQLYKLNRELRKTITEHENLLRNVKLRIQNGGYLILPELSPPVLAAAKGAGMPQGSGIYTVWKTQIMDQCLYVGQSVNLRQRASLTSNGAQRGDGKIRPGEWLSICEADEADLMVVECGFIAALQPARNVGTPCSPGKYARCR